LCNRKKMTGRNVNPGLTEPYGICEREFEEAFESDPNVGTDSPGAEWHAACWARNWVVDHYKDMQEDTCDSFSSC